MHIVTISEMRELEARADKEYGLTPEILMSNAGRSAAEIFKANLLPIHRLKGLKVLFLIGPGNNGGDGLIMANHLEKEGALLSLYYWKEHKLIVQGARRADE